MLFDLLNQPLELLLLVLGLLAAITVHEFAHAALADYFGDPTPRAMGRVSLNPLAHLDPLGTLALLLFRFGWGKPVPVNSRYFKNPTPEEIQVALIGPFANLALAVLLGLLLRLPALPEFLQSLMVLTIQINLVLMIFNLLPIPPLDGSRLLRLFLPRELNVLLEQYGIFILIAVFFFGGPLLSALFNATVRPLLHILTGQNV